jgi:hypothetical protein
MPAYIVHFADPDPAELCPQRGRQSCACAKIDLPFSH